MAQSKKKVKKTNTDSVNARYNLSLNKKLIPHNETAFSWPLAAILVAITFLGLKSCLSFEFLSWDDIDSVLKNDTLAAFSKEWKWENVIRRMIRSNMH
jgi:hypothetical protein